MCKIGDRVNVCFDGMLEAEEMWNKDGMPTALRMCKVTFRDESGRFFIALVGKEFVSSTLTKEEK